MLVLLSLILTISCSEATGSSGSDRNQLADSSAFCDDIFSRMTEMGFHHLEGQGYTQTNTYEGRSIFDCTTSFAVNPAPPPDYDEDEVSWVVATDDEVANTFISSESGFEHGDTRFYVCASGDGEDGPLGASVLDDEEGGNGSIRLSARELGLEEALSDAFEQVYIPDVTDICLGDFSFIPTPLPGECTDFCPSTWFLTPETDDECVHYCFGNLAVVAPRWIAYVTQVDTRRLQTAANLALLETLVPAVKDLPNEPPPQVAEPTLGVAWGPDQRGWGEVEPATIDGGGSAGGQVDDIAWESWGGEQATGSGTGYYVGPGQFGYEASPRTATIVASDLGDCHGQLAYRRVHWYFPSEGETPDSGGAEWDPEVICGGTAGGDGPVVDIEPNGE